jgi:hypothetical protein
MDSWFNIPAPAVVKRKSDVDVEKSWRLKVPVPARKGGGRGGLGRSGFFKTHTKKTFYVFPRLPVPQTDTGGWVEYTQARE